MQIFRLSTAWIKVHQISHVIFQTKSQFAFKVWNFFQCHERQFFCSFLTDTLYAIEKSSTSKCKLATAHIKIHQISHVIFGTKSQYFFKLCTLFSVMRHNSSVLFHLNRYMLWTTEVHQSANFQAFDCSHEN